jgi:hypothetical protein
MSHENLFVVFYKEKKKLMQTKLSNSEYNWFFYNRKYQKKRVFAFNIRQTNRQKNIVFLQKRNPILMMILSVLFVVE